MKYLLAAMLLAATAVLADEPTTYGIPSVHKLTPETGNGAVVDAGPPTITTPVPAPKLQPGGVYSVDKDGKPSLVDLNKLQIQSIEWFEIGLRADGSVMWRRK